MKRTYIKPHTSIVQLNLIGSVLEDIGVNGGSNQGNYEDALSKEHNFGFFDSEEEDFSNPPANSWEHESSR